MRQGTASSSPTLGIDGIVVTNSWNSLLPVELESFNSVVNGRDVVLNWSTISELNNSGFDIERSTLAGDWSKIGNVKGNGTSTGPYNYTFIDSELLSGRYNYRLKQIDFNGNFAYYNLNNKVVIGAPDKFNLSQNYPNPFNPSTKINYDIPFEGKVNLSVFDQRGKRIATMVNEVQPAGYYSLSFNASGLASGIYFYKVNAGDFVSTKKMLLIK